MLSTLLAVILENLSKIVSHFATNLASQCGTSTGRSVTVWARFRCLLVSRQLNVGCVTSSERYKRFPKGTAAY